MYYMRCKFKADSGNVLLNLFCLSLFRIKWKIKVGFELNYLGCMNNQLNCKVEIWVTGSKPHPTSWSTIHLVWPVVINHSIPHLPFFFSPLHCESWAWIEKLTLLVSSRVQFEWCCIIFTLRSLLLEQNRVCFSKGCCLLFTNSKCTLLPCFSLRCLGLETSLLNSPLSIFEMGEKFCEVKKREILHQMGVLM